jgi:tRNA A37 N6-isopentenylltransferase MiaA
LVIAKADNRGMRLFRKREPETAADIRRRVRDHWSPSSPSDNPEFLRIVAREIAKAKRRGRFIEDDMSPGPH